MPPYGVLSQVSIVVHRSISAQNVAGNGNERLYYQSILLLSCKLGALYMLSREQPRHSLKWLARKRQGYSVGGLLKLATRMEHKVGRSPLAVKLANEKPRHAEMCDIFPRALPVHRQNMGKPFNCDHGLTLITSSHSYRLFCKHLLPYFRHAWQPRFPFRPHRFPNSRR